MNILRTEESDIPYSYWEKIPYLEYPWARLLYQCIMNRKKQ